MVSPRVVPRCLHVGQQERGFTKGAPLYTYGVGVCLGVVVHDKAKAYGALAHIGLPHLKDWGKNATYCYKQIASMMQVLATKLGSGQDFQLFLFGSSSALASHPDGDPGFSRRLARALPAVELEDHLAYAPLAGGYGDVAQFLYWPEQGIVAELDDGELRLIKAQEIDGKVKDTLIEPYPDQPGSD